MINLKGFVCKMEVKYMVEDGAFDSSSAVDDYIKEFQLSDDELEETIRFVQSSHRNDPTAKRNKTCQTCINLAIIQTQIVLRHKLRGETK